MTRNSCGFRLSFALLLGSISPVPSGPSLSSSRFASDIDRDDRDKEEGDFERSSGSSEAFPFPFKVALPLVSHLAGVSVVDTEDMVVVV